MAYLCNTGDELSSVPFFLVLEVTGSYFFYPSWCSMDDCPGGNFEVLGTVPTGLTEKTIFGDFSWPSNVGAFDGIRFYGAMVDLSQAQLIGSIGAWEFGYSS
jgi:hypothetical protein